MPEYWKTTQFVPVFSHASSAQSAVIQFTPNTNRIGIMTSTTATTETPPASTTTTFSLHPGTVSNEPFDWTKSNDLKVHNGWYYYRRFDSKRVSRLSDIIICWDNCSLPCSFYSYVRTVRYVRVDVLLFLRSYG